jgi:hypothetical protein
LTLLGVDNVRVIDAHCPDWNVAELLVHENYVEELKSKFAKAKVQPIDYTYTDPVHLRDTRLKDLPVEEKEQKLKDIRTNYLLNIIPRIRYPVNYSVAKAFFRQGFISLDQLKTALKEYRNGKVTDGFTTTENAPSPVMNTNNTTTRKDKGKEKADFPINNTNENIYEQQENQSLITSSSASKNNPSSLLL